MKKSKLAKKRLTYKSRNITFKDIQGQYYGFVTNVDEIRRAASTGSYRFGERAFA